MILKNEELALLKGGSFSLTASYINAISRGAEIILEIGRAIGSAIRRGFSKKYC